jgi:hypothetical protein
MTKKLPPPHPIGVKGGCSPQNNRRKLPAIKRQKQLTQLPARVIDIYVIVWFSTFFVEGSFYSSSEIPARSFEKSSQIEKFRSDFEIVRDDFPIVFQSDQKGGGIFYGCVFELESATRNRDPGSRDCNVYACAGITALATT